MPKLKSRDKHSCFICHQIFAARFPLKDHLIKLSKDKKPRCPALKTVIPSDVWENQILQFYTNDAPLPDLSGFKSTTLKRKRKKTKMISIRAVLAMS